MILLPSMCAAALELLDVEFPATFSDYDGESAAAFLDRLHFPYRARHLALEVFARSFFAHPDNFSAGDLVAMFHSYFLGSSEGLLFDVPRDDYDTCLWSPLRRYLDDLGVEVRAGEAVAWIDASRDMPRIGLASGSEIDASLVLATDPATTRRLAMEVRCPMPGGLIKLRSCAMRRRSRSGDSGWIDVSLSDRPAFLGTSGFGPLDNVSVLERFEEGARRWSAARTARWSSCTRTHFSTSQPRISSKINFWSNCSGSIPSSSRPASLRGVLDQQRLPAPWHRSVAPAASCTDAPPADRAGRRWHSVRLSGCPHGAGSYHGFLAANQLLSSWNVAGHDLWTVPMRSRHRLAVSMHALVAR